MTTEFHRIRRLPPYVFEEVNRIKAKLRAEGTDIIDFGMGNPDMPTPKHTRRQADRNRPRPQGRALFRLQGRHRPASGHGRLPRRR